MTTWCGIGDNVHEPPAGQTRPALAANIRHALAYCFQPQDEIIRRDQLFHGSGDTFFAQALKDTLPYFLGAVDDDYIRKRERLRQVRDQLRSVERRLAELASLRGTGATKASALVAQARDAASPMLLRTHGRTQSPRCAGLHPRRSRTASSCPVAAMSLHGSRMNAATCSFVNAGFATRSLRHARSSRRRRASPRRPASRRRASRASGFRWLHSGNVVPVVRERLKATPELPSTTQLQTALSSVSSRLEAVARGAPRVEKAVAELEGKLAEVQAAMAKNRTEMDAVRLVDKQLRDGEESAVRRAHVSGG